MRSGGSRVARRFGSKSNSCGRCPTGTNGKLTMKFKGRGRARLEQHLREVHGPDRRKVVKPEIDDA